MIKNNKIVFTIFLLRSNFFRGTALSISGLTTHTFPFDIRNDMIIIARKRLELYTESLRFGYMINICFFSGELITKQREDTVGMKKLSRKDMLNFLHNYPGCVFLKDENGCYIYASHLCENVDQWSTGGIVGKNELQAQRNKNLGREYYEQDMKLLREGGSLKCYSKIKREGNYQYYEINKSAVTDDGGNIIGIIGTVIDVTKEFELQECVKTQLITDPITGLYNNTFLNHWKEKKKLIYPFSIIAGDCNFLKHMNDTFGHEKGDELLKHVAKLFRENLPENCYSIRTGGDEFIILCNHTSENDAKRYIAMMQQKSKEISICGITLSIALGSCTMHKENSMTFDECKKCADSRMYQNKRDMKKRYFDTLGKSNPIYNELFMRKILNQMPVILFFKDTRCRYRYINFFDERNLRNEQKDGFGIGCTDMEIQKDPNLAREYYEDDLKILKTGMGSVLIKDIPGEDGIRYYQIIKSAVRDEKNNIIGIVGTVIDITATKMDFDNN